jgi:hypothetical protein
MLYHCLTISAIVEDMDGGTAAIARRRRRPRRRRPLRRRPLRRRPLRRRSNEFIAGSAGGGRRAGAAAAAVPVRRRRAGGARFGPHAPLRASALQLARYAHDHAQPCA